MINKGGFPTCPNFIGQSARLLAPHTGVWNTKNKFFLKFGSLVSQWTKKISKNINISQNGGDLKKNSIFTQKFSWICWKKIVERIFFQFRVVHRQMTYLSNLYTRVQVDRSNTFWAMNRAILKSVKPKKTRLKIDIEKIVGKK